MAKLFLTTVDGLLSGLQSSEANILDGLRGERSIPGIELELNSMESIAHIYLCR